MPEIKCCFVNTTVEYGYSDPPGSVHYNKTSLYPINFLLFSSHKGDFVNTHKLCLL